MWLIPRKKMCVIKVTSNAAKSGVLNCVTEASRCLQPCSTAEQIRCLLSVQLSRKPLSFCLVYTVAATG